MIKIIKGVTEYNVEPKVATLYYVDRYNKDVVKIENCIFENASPVVWGASDANDYLLKYDIDEDYAHVRVDITTGKVKDDGYTFFDYEQAVRVHKARRMEFLKGEVARLKEYQKELKELEK